MLEPITEFTEPALLWLAGTVRNEVGPITFFTDPAFLWLASTVIGEFGAHNMFEAGSTTVVDWHGYGRGRGP